MSTVLNIIIGILIFTVIVVVHELGHMLLAKKAGISVPEFSVGFGPRLFSFKIGETRYSFKLLPLGGSCQMLGEDEIMEDERAFNNKGVWARFSVLFAGPFFNFLLAFVLSIIIIAIAGIDHPTVTLVTEGSAAEAAGLQAGDIITSFDGSRTRVGRELAMYFEFNKLGAEPVEVEYERNGEDYETVLTPKLNTTYRLGFSYMADSTEPAVTEVSKGGAMELAGVEAGDVILSIDGTAVKTGEEVMLYFSEHPMDGSSVTLEVKRGGETRSLTVTPNYIEEYLAGFSYNYHYREKTGPFETLGYALNEVKYWIVSTVKSLGKLITGQLSTDQIGGPVRIVKELGSTIESSKEDGTLYVVLNLMNWAILLSANLGVMNLLPLPALDGGRIVFVLIEAIRGKPISKEKEGMVHLIGFILLMVLMVFVFYNDIKNIFF